MARVPRSFWGSLWLCVLYLLLLSAYHPAHAQGDIAQQEYDALVLFYEAMDGDNWTNNSGWLIGDDPGRWFGCGGMNDRITGVLLPNNNLVGQLPPELQALERLEWLDLSNNRVHGTIPPEYGSFAYMKAFELDNNEMSGPIPQELSNLTNLTHLYLHGNAFTGPLPPVSRMTQLIELIVASNQLSGPLPDGLGNLTNLVALSLRQNQFSGPIPPEIGNLKRLKVLDLQENQLSGPLPVEIGGLTSLEQLNLFLNDVSGAVPETICNLTRLRGLQLADNAIEDLPDLSCLPQLDDLHVQFNRLTFEDLEPNMGVAQHFFYEPQAPIGEARTDTVAMGAAHTLSYDVGGEHNVYQWYVGPDPIDGATTDTYVIEAAELGDTGYYQLTITNTVVPDLTLNTYPVLVWVDAPPTLPFILEPADGTALTIEGDANTLVHVAWHPAVDPNGGVVTYTWQFALADDFETPILEIATSEQPSLDLNYGTIYTLLTDHGVTEGSTVQIYQRVVASDGGMMTASDPCALTVTLGFVNVADEHHASLPRRVRLHGNYPNPFNPSTQLVFDLPTAADVSAEVIDLTGRALLRTPTMRMAPGYERTVRLNGQHLASGVYIYRLQIRTDAARQTLTGTCILLR